MQHLATLIALTFSVVHGHLLPRDNPNETVTFAIDPSPTLTNAPVSSAYSVYAQKCGPDLDSIAYSWYPQFTSAGGSAAITAQAFLDWMGDADSGWQNPCLAADSDLVDAVRAASPDTTSTASTTTTAPPQPGPSTGDQSSFSFSGCLPSNFPSGIPSGLSGLSIPGGIPTGFPGLDGRDNQAATSSCQGSQIDGAGGSATGGSAAPAATKNAASGAHPRVHIMFTLAALGVLRAVV
ncbi:hypothetical protein DFH06DRAFT_62761 [Mycena polygramma]|nr:hypothetical protein DFH06DRAFT_62761 [Mycena polygramma]